MPKITISKKDLLAVRYMLHKAAEAIETAPNPAAGGRHALAARRVIPRLNKAIKDAYGHSCNAWLFVKGTNW